MLKTYEDRTRYRVRTELGERDTTAVMADLKKWLAGLDVLLLPYINDEMIRQSDPLKLRECLASGRPTVSIDIPEVRRYQPWVRVAATRDDFVAQVTQAALENGDVESAAARQRSVTEDGWDNRAAQLQKWLSTMIAANGHAVVS